MKNRYQPDSKRAYTPFKEELDLADALAALRGRNLDEELLTSEEKDKLAEMIFQVTRRYLLRGKQRRIYETMQIPIDAVADEVVMRVCNNPKILAILIRDGLYYMHKVTTTAGTDCIRAERKYAESVAHQEEDDWNKVKAPDTYEVAGAFDRLASAAHIFLCAREVLNEREFLSFFSICLLCYKPAQISNVVSEKGWSYAFKHVVEETARCLDLQLPSEGYVAKLTNVNVTSQQLSKSCHTAKRKLRNALGPDYPEYSR